MSRRNGWMLLLVANALFYCVLSFYSPSVAAPKPAPEPFANPTEQRLEMVAHLKEIKDLLKEQNSLLRSGEVKVVVAEPK